MVQTGARLRTGIKVGVVVLALCGAVVGMFGLAAHILQARTQQLEELPQTTLQSTLKVEEGKTLEEFRNDLEDPLEKDGAVYRLDKVDYLVAPGTVLNEEETAGEGGVWRRFTETRTQTLDGGQADSIPSAITVEEEGFSGELQLQSSNKTPISSTYQVQVDHQMTFSDLPDNDVSRLPETYVFPLSDGSGQATFRRAAVSFRESAWDSYGIPTTFEATVTYRGLETRSETSSYVVESVYVGELFKPQDYQVTVSYQLDEEATALKQQAAASSPVPEWIQEVPGMATLYQLKDLEGWRGVLTFALLLFALLAAALVAILLVLRNARVLDKGPSSWAAPPPLAKLESPQRHGNETANTSTWDDSTWDAVSGVDNTLSANTFPTDATLTLQRGE